MTFVLKVTSQSNYIVAAKWGDTERDIRPGDSLEIIADDDVLVKLARRKPPEVENKPPEGAPPYTLTAVIDPVSGEAPLTSTLTLTEADSAAQSFTVDWGDGSPAETAPDLVKTHIYAAAGDFTGSVTATRGEGITPEVVALATVSVTEPVTEAPPPADPETTSKKKADEPPPHEHKHDKEPESKKRK